MTVGWWCLLQRKLFGETCQRETWMVVNECIDSVRLTVSDKTCRQRDSVEPRVTLSLCNIMEGEVWESKGEMRWGKEAEKEENNWKKRLQKRKRKS